MIAPNVAATVETMAFLKALTEDQLRSLQSELNQELYARYEAETIPDLDLEAEI